MPESVETLMTRPDIKGMGPRLRYTEGGKYQESAQDDDVNTEQLVAILREYRDMPHVETLLRVPTWALVWAVKLGFKRALVTVRFMGHLDGFLEPIVRKHDFFASVASNRGR